MMRSLALSLFVIAFTCSMHADPAQALRSRVFVSKTGADVGACSFSAPCQSLDFALNGVEPGGEITILDSGGYNPITITIGVTITVPPGVEAGFAVPAGGTGITINAGSSDVIVLRGLTLNGNGVAYNGVAFNSGGSLTVINCFVQNFVFDGSNTTTGNGILIQPTSGTVNFTITDSVVTNNGQAGIFYRPQGTPNANGVVDNVTATGNQYGISFNTNSSTTGATLMAVSNSVLSNNKVDGLFSSNGAGQSLTVSIDHVSIVGNGSIGIDAETTSAVILGRSVITGNVIGVKNNTPNTFFTYQDNRIFGDTTTDISSPLNPSVLLQ
jgi:hypothetical protein